MMKLPYNFAADKFLRSVGSAFKVEERFLQKNALIMLLRVVGHSGASDSAKRSAAEAGL